MQSRDTLTYRYLYQHYPLAPIASLLGKEDDTPWPVPILFAMEQLHGDQESLRLLLLKCQPNLAESMFRHDPPVQLNAEYKHNNRSHFDELQLLTAE